MNQQVKKSGFTLIELMLSMTFVSVLLLTIALTVVQMSTTYNRGMTMKEVNQVSRDIADDLRLTVGGSSVFTVNETGNTNAYVTLRTLDDNKVVGGRLCTGVSSYIWNSSFALERNLREVSKLENAANAAEGAGVSLYKVPDADKRYCGLSGSAPITQHIRYSDRVAGRELLKTGDRNLGLQEFSVVSSSSAEDLGIRQKMYTVNYRIGTGSTEAMNADQTACLAPGENVDGVDKSNWTYCNIQQFTIVVRAGNATR